MFSLPCLAFFGGGNLSIGIEWCVYKVQIYILYILYLMSFSICTNVQRMRTNVLLSLYVIYICIGDDRKHSTFSLSLSLVFSITFYVICFWYTMIPFIHRFIALSPQKPPLPFFFLPSFSHSAIHSFHSIWWWSYHFTQLNSTQLDSTVYDHKTPRSHSAFLFSVSSEPSILYVLCTYLFV